MEKDFFALTGADSYEIRLLHAVIWLSLTTYAWQDYDSVCGAFYAVLPQHQIGKGTVAVNELKLLTGKLFQCFLQIPFVEPPMPGRIMIRSAVRSTMDYTIWRMFYDQLF